MNAPERLPSQTTLVRNGSLALVKTSVLRGPFFAGAVSQRGMRCESPPRAWSICQVRSSSPRARGGCCPGGMKVGSLDWRHAQLGVPAHRAALACSPGRHLLPPMPTAGCSESSCAQPFWQQPLSCAKLVPNAASFGRAMDAATSSSRRIEAVPDEPSTFRKLQI